jgi:hypothetical protein
MGCGGMGMGVVIMLSKNGFWNAQVFLFVLFFCCWFMGGVICLLHSVGSITKQQKLTPKPGGFSVTKFLVD